MLKWELPAGPMVQFRTGFDQYQGVAVKIELKKRPVQDQDCKR